MVTNEETREISEMEKLLLEEENMPKDIYKGTVVEGVVVLKKEDGYYIDLRYKTEGFLPNEEVFEDEEINEGDHVRLFVIKVDKNNGEILLSKKRVDEIAAWDNIKVGVVKEVRGLEVNSKGLIVNYESSIKGFVPLSQLELKYVGEDVARTYIGKDFEVEVLDVDPKKRRLILSRKAILQKLQDEKIEELSGEIAEGKVFTGVIKDIKDYGIFVDIGGIVGLVHISEISWDKTKKIKDMFKINGEVKVKVLSFDPETVRLSLSIKALKEHPWDEYIEEHKVGDIVEGTVKNIKDYGVFINLCPIVDGFVHISNISKDFVKNPSEVLEVGQEVQVKIIGINEDEKKIELSMLLNDEPEEGEENTQSTEEAANEEVQEELN